MDLGFVRFIKDEDGRSIVNEDAIRRRWKEYFSALLTKEVDSIGANPQNNCYCPRIRHTEVKEALRKMGRNKVVGPDEIPIEAWKCLGGEGVRWLTLLSNKTFLRAKMPEEWRHNEVSENQFGFMPGRSSMEAIHIIRSLVEKYRERQKDFHLAFLDLEKAYDSVLRELIWKTLRDKGTPVKYIKVIQDMYEGARTCVRTPTGNSKYFPMDVGLHQGSAISPYLFALILDELSRGIQESIPWCLIFADVLCWFWTRRGTKWKIGAVEGDARRQGPTRQQREDREDKIPAMRLQRERERLERGSENPHWRSYLTAACV
uniref:Retrovirus-related Pol polyprotein LINE-1 n=1 Tax=Tanacetum cinerariifolium TaxID=118510 RepID=A0A6L2MLW0_TANCI|nr:retrovirus-related Pol polyprotein LINE-1 [Tanacetum cinerariifolium]